MPCTLVKLPYFEKGEKIAIEQRINTKGYKSDDSVLCFVCCLWIQNALCDPSSLVILVSCECLGHMIWKETNSIMVILKCNCSMLGLPKQKK